jgi:hypothetical protein
MQEQPSPPSNYLKTQQNKAFLHQQKASTAGWLWVIMQAEQKTTPAPPLPITISPIDYYIR